MITEITMKQIFLMALSTLILGGCKYFETKQALLTGDRITVLQHERSLSADAEVSGQQILLPAPSPNFAWPQSGGYANQCK